MRANQIFATVEKSSLIRENGILLFIWFEEQNEN